MSLGEIVARLRNLPTPPWLSNPIYKNFVLAIHPKIDIETLSDAQYQVWLFLHRNQPPTEDMRFCLGYWSSHKLKTALNALMFGGASDFAIDETLRLGIKAIEYYRELFCDLSVFRGSKLLLSDYVSQLPELGPSEQEEKQLYLLSIDYGWEWVMWKLTKGLSGHIEGTKILDVLINSAFWKAMEASTHPLDSKESVEGRYYMKQAAEMALDKHRSKMGSFNSVKELELRLTAAKRQDYVEASVLSAEPPPEIADLLYSTKENT